MSDKPVALQMADDLDRLGSQYDEEIASELRRLHTLNAELVEALRSTGLFLHHVWCDVQMNDYSFEKLNQQMQVVDAALAKWEAST